MKVRDVLRSMQRHKGASNSAVSSAMGKSPRYLDPILYGDRSPQVDNFAAMCDVLDFDLLVRAREDGMELIIDPPDEV